MKENLLLISFVFGCFVIQAQPQDYLTYVMQHCDNLITHGKDNYGAVKTDMLASVIDTRDMSVPKSGVPATEGTRSHDRAVGGSNYYHHVTTNKVLNYLSKITGNQKYKQAAILYAQDFLRNCQNSFTGLLGWGEHMYYNFYADKVMVGDLDNPRDNLYHEFLAETPPWEYFWQIDSAATKRAIKGIKYHFRSPTTQSYLFNRHARWNKVAQNEYRGVVQYQDGGQPWIKHSGLQTFSFTFLYNKTEEDEWLRWMNGTGSLYWNYRNKITNLTLSCIDDPRPNSQRSSLNGTALLSYYLLKAYQLDPKHEDFKNRAEILLKAAEKYSWNSERNGYYSRLNLDGTVFDEELVPVVHTGYGGSDILLFGRVAAYFYSSTGDPVYRQMVEKVYKLLAQNQWPASFVINSIADGLQFSLDAYLICREEEILSTSKLLANLAIEKFWSGKMFVRQPGDPYYEAKLGTGNLMAALLRLHQIENEATYDQELKCWSF